MADSHWRHGREAGLEARMLEDNQLTIRPATARYVLRGTGHLGPFGISRIPLKSTLWRGCHGNWIGWSVRTNFAALCKERSRNTSVLNDGSGHSGLPRNVLQLSNKDKLSKANLGSVEVFWSPGTSSYPQSLRGTGAPTQDSLLRGSRRAASGLLQNLPGSVPPASCWGCGSCDSVPLSSLQSDGKNSWIETCWRGL